MRRIRGIHSWEKKEMNASYKIIGVVFLILSGFTGNVFAQNIDNSPDKIWLPACHIETDTDCDQSLLFHDAVSEPFSQSDSVAIGTIIQKENLDENSISYSINVDFYLKNYQQFDLLTVSLIDAPELQTFSDVSYYNSPVFNEGDLVFVYLIKNDGHYEILPESFALDKHEVRGPPPTILLEKSPSEVTFEQGEKITVSGEVRKMDLVMAARDGEKLDAKLTLLKSDGGNSIVLTDLMDIEPDGSYNYTLDTSKIAPGRYDLEVNYGPSTTGPEIEIKPNWKLWTPLKQLNSGISFNEILCKENLVRIQKHDGTPACVSHETKETLIERGWTGDDVSSTFDYIVEKDGVTYGSQYQISGGIVEDVVYNKHTNSLIVSLDKSKNGFIQIVIQTGLLHLRDEVPYTYIVIADGEEIDFEQLSPIILKIPFEEGTKKIEIVGTLEI